MIIQVLPLAISLLLITTASVIGAPAPIYKEPPFNSITRIEGKAYTLKEGINAVGYTYQLNKNRHFNIYYGGYEGIWTYKNGVLTMHETLKHDPSKWRIYSFQFDIKTLSGQGRITFSHDLTEIDKPATIELKETKR